MRDVSRADARTHVTSATSRDAGVGDCDDDDESAPHCATRRIARSAGAIERARESAHKTRRARRRFPRMSRDDDARADAAEADDSGDDLGDFDLAALVRRARAIASVANETEALTARLAEAEREWGQAITSRGRRYYFSKIGESVQWETPRALKGSTTKVYRADLLDRAALPSGWRELKSKTVEAIPYYWNVRTGEVQWERPINDDLPVATVVPATATR